jgi:hypothetical protein
MASTLADSPQHRIIATPATVYTREVAFAVKMSTAQGLIERLPVRGDLYSANRFGAQVRMGEFKNFVCTNVDDGGEGYFWAYYCAPKTPAEALAPFAPTEQRYGNHYWPPILLDVEIVEIRLGRSVNTGDKVKYGKAYQAVPVWIPSADTGTLFVKRKMLTPEEPKIPQHSGMQTRSVGFPVPGGQPFSFGENLGPEINIRAMYDKFQDYDVVSETVGSNVGILAPRSFKATDPTFWVSQFVYDTPTRLATGGYVREQLEAFPPNLPPRQRGR